MDKSASPLSPLSPCTIKQRLRSPLSQLTKMAPATKRTKSSGNTGNASESENSDAEDDDSSDSSVTIASSDSSSEDDDNVSDSSDSEDEDDNIRVEVEVVDPIKYRTVGNPHSSKFPGTDSAIRLEGFHPVNTVKTVRMLSSKFDGPDPEAYCDELAASDADVSDGEEDDDDDDDDADKKERRAMRKSEIEDAAESIPYFEELHEYHEAAIEQRAFVGEKINVLIEHAPIGIAMHGMEYQLVLKQRDDAPEHTVGDSIKRTDHVHVCTLIEGATHIRTLAMASPPLARMKRVCYHCYIPPTIKGLHLSAAVQDVYKVRYSLADFPEDNLYLFDADMTFVVVAMNGAPVPNMNDPDAGVGVETYHLVGIPTKDIDTLLPLKSFEFNVLPN